MEYSSRFGLEQYYRDLEIVQKSILNKKHAHHKSEKTHSFIKTKSQVPIKNIKRQQTYLKLNDIKNRFSLHLNQKNQESIKNAESLKGLPRKYLEDIDESLIGKKVQVSSSLTKQDHQKIILQIHGLQVGQGDDQIATVKNQQSRKSKNTGHQFSKKNHRQIAQPQKYQLKNLYEDIHFEQISENTKCLISKLKQRNKLYDALSRKCGNKSLNLQQQFEKIWKKFQLYKSFINKITNLAAEENMDNT